MLPPLSTLALRFMLTTNWPPRSCGEHAGSLGSCKHVKAADCHITQINAEQAEERFARWFDPMTQRRKLTCKSRQPIPQHISRSDRADAYARMLSFPGLIVWSSCCYALVVSVSFSFHPPPPSPPPPPPLSWMTCRRPCSWLCHLPASEHHCNALCHWLGSRLQCTVPLA